MVIAMYIRMPDDIKDPLYRPAYHYTQRQKYKCFVNLHAFSYALR